MGPLSRIARDLSVLSVFMLVACTVKPASDVPASSEGGDAAAEGDGDGDAADDGGDPSTNRQPVSAPEPAPGDDAGASADLGCDSDADCGEGQLCEGMGCGPAQGVCVEKGRMCTRDLRAYCGCDGQTFKSSGSCPGRRFAYRGECAAPKPDGSECLAPEQCESGSCEGLGCGDDTPGKCMPKERACTADLAPYCGCDGKTFQSSGSCPGRRYAAAGACEGAAADGG